MDLKNEHFIFIIKELLTLKFKCINVKKYGKKFKTDISNIVDKNSNFTHEFKEKYIELAGLFFGSIRKIAYKIKKDTGISISRQIIENWILGYKIPKTEINNRYSGYYIFNVE